MIGIREVSWKNIKQATSSSQLVASEWNAVNNVDEVKSN